MDAIRALVRDYLLENVGNMMVPGSPIFDEARKLWHVPAFCWTDRGLLLAGEVYLDESLRLAGATPKEQMVATVERQLERLLYLVPAKEGELEAAGFEPVKA